MQTIELLPGKRYFYQRGPIRLLRVLDLHQVLAEVEATGSPVAVPISQLQPIPPEGTPAPLPLDDLLGVSDSAWAKAEQRLAVLRPILADRADGRLIQQAARDHGVSVATIYRWLRAYEETGSVRSLVEVPNTGGKGQPRLEPALEAIIRQAIETQYLTTQKKPVTKVILEVRQQCRQEGLPAPGENTVRRRILALSEEEKTRRRWSKRMAREKFDPIQGEFPGADFPLAYVQMDHTRVDLMLVDETYRQPLDRPYLTLAIDVFSRMVVGFYVSFDPPGAIAAGLCMAHAILPKESWLEGLKITGEWPCWGKPEVLHLDNAREFRGKTLARACQKYGTRLEFRPVKKPHWGGHIERLMGTFMKEVHTLPGTTFSNVPDRKDYPSEKNAAMTLPEFERWLTLFIVNVYHRRLHKALNTSPYERYREGVFGSPTQPGTGLPERFYDELQIRLDFMPGEWRTIQEYGVVMDHVYYYAHVLTPYINSLEVGPAKHRPKRKFLFKRDPRDISYLYFLDPANKQYHCIPYRETTYPAMSVWELRQAVALAKVKGKENIDEEAIFEAYEEMHRQEMAAVERTRSMNKTQNRLVQGTPANTVAALMGVEPTPTLVAPSPPTATPQPLLTADRERPARTVILPFDDYHDDALGS